MLPLLGIIAVAGIVAGASGHFVGATIAYIVCGLVFYVRNSRRRVDLQVITPVIMIIAMWPIALYTEVWLLWNDPERFQICEELPLDDPRRTDYHFSPKIIDGRLAYSSPERPLLAQKRTWGEALEVAKRAASQTGHEITILDRRRTRKSIIGTQVSRIYRVAPDGKVSDAWPF